MVTTSLISTNKYIQKNFRAYQRLRMLRLHRLGYSDHDDGGSGKTAENQLLPPSTTSASIVAVDSLAERRRSVRNRTAPNPGWRIIFVCADGTGCL
jgi:hypothetical protein